MADILILGAGYTGIMAATHLDKATQPFTLINRHPYHYFTTLLHEAAGGRGNRKDYSVTLKNLLHKPTSQLVVGEVRAIERHRHAVVTGEGEYFYDRLIIALGWVPAYFGIEGLDKYSLVLTNLESAMNIRQHIERQFQAYVDDKNPERLRVVVGGAGLTGVELTGELLDWLPTLCVKYGIDASLVEVHNIEAMPTVLPQVSESLRNTAAEVLERKGAVVRTGTKIVKVEENRVHLATNERVHARTIIWTGGVKANPILRAAGFTVDGRGRAIVDGYLKSVDDDSVFIGGDSACFETHRGNQLPPTAQVATQMGRAIGRNLVAAVQGKEMQPFRVSLKGTLASIGREEAVGDVGGIPVRGMVATVAKEATKIKYLWELGGARLAGEKTDIVGR